MITAKEARSIAFDFHALEDYFEGLIREPAEEGLGEVSFFRDVAIPPVVIKKLEDEGFTILEHKSSVYGRNSSQIAYTISWK